MDSHKTVFVVLLCNLFVVYVGLEFLPGCIGLQWWVLTRLSLWLITVLYLCNKCMNGILVFLLSMITLQLCFSIALATSASGFCGRNLQRFSGLRSQGWLGRSQQLGFSVVLFLGFVGLNSPWLLG